LNNKTDVLVVGGGPCGSFAALTAVKLGAEVVVCEEHKEIGLPQHCAGHVSLSGLRRLGLSLPQKIVENRIRRAVFYSASGQEFRVELDSPVTLVLNRELFDKHIADLALKAGVRYMLGARVQSFLWKSKFVTGVSLRRETVESDVVIDAEGCSSVLLRTTKLQPLNRSMVVNAVQAEVERIDDVDADSVEVYLGRKFAPGLFAWIIPRRDGSAKVGLATKSGNPRERLQYFLNHHPTARKKMRNSRVVSLSYHPIPLGGPIPETYCNGLLIVGDAASQVKPTTGGGIVMGLTCAKVAGETAHQAIQNGNCSNTLLSTYQKRWRKTIGFDMAVMRQIRLIVNRLSDQQLDKIIFLCSQLHLDEDLKRVRDIDFQGRGTMPIFTSPAVWAVTLYSILASLTTPF
jgi:digeranylgeranylglycerophospholipid reductase